jgi:hypothetical protein
MPKAVTEHKDLTVLWNQVMKIDGKVLVNRPDIIVKN